MNTRTTTTLLEGLADPVDDSRWREFDDRYRPILFALARRLGLGCEDSADAAQEAMVQFVRGYRAGRYDRSRGRLSSWLMAIAHNCARDAIGRRTFNRGGSALADVPDEAEDVWKNWRDACELEIVRRATERLRDETRTEPRTIQAFELLLVGQSVAVVAEALAMTANDVYLAKHRCLRRIRAIVTELRSAYEID